jgi:hypothetical protein
MIVTASTPCCSPKPKYVSGEVNNVATFDIYSDKLTMMGSEGQYIGERINVASAAHTVADG